MSSPLLNNYQLFPTGVYLPRIFFLLQTSDVDDGNDGVELESGFASTTKPTKLVRVKVEQIDK